MLEQTIHRILENLESEELQLILQDLDKDELKQLAKHFIKQKQFKASYLVSRYFYANNPSRESARLYTKNLSLRKDLASLDKELQRLDPKETKLIYEFNYFKAEVLKKKEEFDKALELLDGLPASDKSRMEVRLLKTNCLVERGTLDEALEYMQDVFEGDDNYAVLKIRRNIYMYKKDASKIFETYQELIRKDASKEINIEHFIGSGLSANAEKELYECLKVYCEADPQRSLDDHMAKVLFKQRHWKKALDLWSSVLKDDPLHQSAVYGYSQCLFYLNLFDVCDDFLSSVFEKEEFHYSALKSQIVVNRNLYYRTEAIDLCRKAMELYPRDVGMVKEHTSVALHDIWNRRAEFEGN